MKYITLEEVCENRTSNISQKDLKENEGIYPIYGASGLIKKVDFYTQDKEYIGIVKDGAGVGRIMLLPSKSSVIGTMQYIIPNGILDTKYLYYALISKKLSKYSSGATIPHIYFKDYKKEKIVLISESEQKKVINILDRIIDIINKKKNQINLLEELVKSRFIEMFGDPIRNEKGWEIDEWKNLFKTQTGKLDSNAMVEGGKYPFFTCAKEIFYIDEYLFDCEALILAGNNAAGIYDVKYYNGKFNAYQRTYVINLINKEYSYIFFKFLLESKLKYLKDASKGSSTRYLTMSILNNLRFILPPLSLQNTFTEFVTSIDKLKFEAEKSLKEMENLYESLMQKFFKQN